MDKINLLWLFCIICAVVTFEEKKPEMELKAILMSLSVLLLTLQGVSSTLCGVTNYSSPVSYYTKLVKTNIMFFDDWVSRCQALGMGWDIVSIDTEAEYNFISQAHFSDYHQTEYFVGGSAASTAFRQRLPQNFGFEDGLGLHIVATTYVDELGFEGRVGNIVRQTGALCEKSTNRTNGYEFSSATSYYRKLVYGNGNSFSYWKSRCTDLGDGWDPAVIETRRELDFIQRAQVWFSDIRHYWIGGVSSFGHREEITPCSLDQPGSIGSNRVFITTYKNRRFRREVLRMKAAHPYHNVPGVLCEKHKPEV